MYLLTYVSFLSLLQANIFLEDLIITHGSLDL